MAEIPTDFHEETMNLFTRGLLQPDEQVVYAGRMHGWYVVIWSILMVACSLGLFFLVGYYMDFRAGRTAAMPEAGPFILSGMALLLVPVYFGLKYILDSRSSWIVLTSRNRVIGKVPSAVMLSGCDQINLAVREIQNIEFKRFRLRSGSTQGGGWWGFLIVILLECLLDVDKGKIKIAAVDGRTISFHNLACPEAFYKQVQAARAAEGLITPDWEELDREKARKSARWGLIFAVVVVVAILVAIAMVPFLPDKSKPVGKPAEPGGRQEQPAGVKQTPETVIPPQQQTSPASTAKEYLDQARATKDPGQKMALTNKAVETDSRYEPAVKYRGDIYYEMGDYNRAVEDYTKAMELDPNDAAAANSKGNSYTRLKKYDEALSDYNKAIKINPKYTAAYYNIGLYRFNNKEFDTAIDLFTKALELNDKYTLAYKARGSSFLAKSEYDSALRDFDKAIDLNPKFGAAYTSRGVLYYRKGEFDKCIQDSTKAIELTPGDPVAYRNRAAAYNKLGQSDLAVENTRKAEELEKQNN